MIDFRFVDKYFGGEPLFRDVTFRIDRGERIGMVGPNGAGKSTLLGIITGDIPYEKGSVNLEKNLRIGHLKQQLPDAHDNVTLLDFTADAIADLRVLSDELNQIEHKLHKGTADNAEQSRLLQKAGELQSQLEHLGAYRLRSAAEAALCSLGFPPDRLNAPLKSFSGGWQMRAMLAKVLISDPDLLLLDEPSNYLDIPAVEWLCKFLKSYSGTLLMISHDRFLLRKLCNITIEVNNDTVTRYSGNYDYYRNAREARYAALAAAKRNIDRKKEHLERVIDRFRAKATKAAQAKSQQKALDRLEDIELPDQLTYSGSIRFPAPPPAGSEAARFENVSFSYRPDVPVLRDVTLDIACGDKIAFVGYNGTGKTTLLKLLVGKLKPTAGRVVLGRNIVTGYQAQEFGDIFAPEESVFDAVRDNLPQGAKANNLMNVLGAFGFSGNDTEKPCKVLSGGEKIRLCFARIFVNPPNLLILDEPTTHLDVAARELLQQAIADYKGTVCVVSHDIEFVRAIATTIVAMEEHSIRKYFGNYDYYLEKSTSLRAPDPVKEKPRVAEGSRDSRELRKERAAARAAASAKKKEAAQKVASLENEIDRLQKRQQELAELLADRNAKINFQMTNRELFEIQQTIEKRTAEWEEAALKLDEIEKSLAQP